MFVSFVSIIDSQTLHECVGFSDREDPALATRRSLGIDVLRTDSRIDSAKILQCSVIIFDG